MTELREGMQGVDPVRLKVDEWLAGVEATREGMFDVFFIQGPEGTDIQVTPANADEVELRIRRNFADRYPDLTIDTPEASVQ